MGTYQNAVDFQNDTSLFCFYCSVHPIIPAHSADDIIFLFGRSVSLKSNFDPLSSECSIESNPSKKWNEFAKIFSPQMHFCSNLLTTEDSVDDNQCFQKPDQIICDPQPALKTLLFCSHFIKRKLSSAHLYQPQCQLRAPALFQYSIGNS